MTVRIFIPWLVLATFLGFVAGGSLASALGGHSQCKFSSFLEHMPDWFVAIFTALLVYVTHRLVTSTNKLWAAGERQFALASETAQRQLRAYVAIDACHAVGAAGDGNIGSSWQHLAIGRTPTAIVSYKNTGQTPAYDVRITGEAELLAWPIDEGLLTSAPTTARSQAVLGRDGSREVHIRELSLAQLTEDRMNDLLNGRIAFVTWGRITYKDIFGKEWWTDFRYFTGGSKLPGSGGLGMAAHDNGNEAT